MKTCSFCQKVREPSYLKYMNIKMNDSRINSIRQLRRLEKTKGLFEFRAEDKKEAYAWLGEKLDQFDYFKLSKKDRGKEGLLALLL